MKKNYIFFLLIAASLITTQYTIAQNKELYSYAKENIEGLAIYPNPVNHQDPYIYITSTANTIKNIELYNVLGKLVFSTKLTGKELNISKLNKGFYVLKITENNKSETKKLVIK